MEEEYRVTIGEEQYRITLRDDSTVLVNGTPYAFDFKAEAGRGFSLLLNGTSFQIFLATQRRSSDRLNSEEPLQLTVNGNPYSVTVDDKRSLLLKSLVGKQSVQSADFTLKSPMPGLVTKIEVQKGEKVHAGQGLVVLEAMKMENELKAPGNGIITAIHIKQGVAVEKGEKLVTISHT